MAIASASAHDRAQLEGESKWRIPAAHSDAVRERLRSELGEPRRYHQRNRFYDSPDGRLRAVGLSLRLRLENQRLICTCKTRGRVVGDRHEREEYEWPLNVALWPLGADPATDLRHCLPLPQVVREALGPAPLQLWGEFANLRLAWHDGGAELALDRSEFPGDQVDHELEIEGPAAVAETWRRRLSAWGIPFSTDSESKLQRFARLQEQT